MSVTMVALGVKAANGWGDNFKRSPARRRPGGLESAFDNDFKRARERAHGADSFTNSAPVAVFGLDHGQNFTDHDQSMAGTDLNAQSAVITLVPVDGRHSCH